MHYICIEHSYGNVETRKNTPKYIFTPRKGAFSWFLKKQVATLQTIEAKYMIVTCTTFQTIWLQRMPNGFKHEQKDPIKISCDYKFAIVLTKNIMFYGKDKYINTKFHSIKKLGENCEIRLEFLDVRGIYFYKIIKD